MRMRKSIKLFMSAILLGILCTGCAESGVAQTEPSAASPQPTEAVSVSPAASRKPKASLTLTLLTDKNYADGIDGRIVEEVNRVLADKGYDFAVKIVGEDATEYDKYQNYLSRAKKRKKAVDILFTGFGADDREDTYTRNVREKNLAEWDSFLKTEHGKELKKQFDSKMWEKMKEGGHIYGIYNAKELSSTCYLLVNKRYFPDGSPVDGFDMEQVAEVMDAVELEPGDVGFYLDEAALYETMGYEKNPLDNRYYDHATGKAVKDVEKEEKIKKARNFVSEGDKKGWLDVTGAGLGKVYEGNFAMAVVDAYSEMVNDSQFVVDGHSFEVYSYPLVHKYIPVENNAVMGVASWSGHKEEAFELLYAINTDADISNLLQYGLEGRDYTLQDGRVQGTVSPNNLLPSCPANKSITYPFDAEGMDKAEDSKKQNEHYLLFPGSK